MVFITAHPDEPIEEQVTQAGAIRLLLQSFSEEALTDALHAVLGI